MVKLGSGQFCPVQDVAVALAVAVVDGQLLHGLELATELNVLGRLAKIRGVFICGLFKKSLFFTKLY